MIAGFWQAFRNTFLLSFYTLLFGFPVPIILAKATHKRVLLSFDAQEGVFSFGIDTVLPNGTGKLPMFILLSFHPHSEPV